MFTKLSCGKFGPFRFAPLQYANLELWAYFEAQENALNCIFELKLGNNDVASDCLIHSDFCEFKYSNSEIDYQYKNI